MPPLRDEAGQERVLAIRITREGWEEALGSAALTSPAPGQEASWREELDASPVRVQWDPERNLRGARLEHRSIQVGLSRHVVPRYVDEWTVSIADATPLARRIDQLRRDDPAGAARLLPEEQPYPLPPEIARRIGAG